MKNPFNYLFSRKQESTTTMQTDEGNQLFEQLFEFLTENLVVWAGKDTKEFITKGYMYNDLVYSIVRYTQEIGRSIKWQMQRVVDEKAYTRYQYHVKEIQAGKNILKSFELAQKYHTKAFEEVLTGPAFDLIKHPNSHQGFNEIIEEFFGWLSITGNFYLYGNKRDDSKGTFRSFHVAPSHQMEIIGGNWMNPIKGYKLKNWVKDFIPVEDILHIKNWNPDFDAAGRQLYGLSPLQAGARILTLDNLGIDTSASSYNNNGVRAIIHRAVTGKGDLSSEFTPEQAANIKQTIEKWKGTTKAGSLAATNAPIGITEIGKSPVDLGVLDAMDKNAVRLCNLFQVPPELFLPGTTFSNKAEARKQLITAGILPKLDIFKEKFQRFAVDKLSDDRNKYVIDYDLFSITELQEDLSKIATMLQGADWVTDNEKREAMNYEADENPLANEIWKSPMNVPLSAFSTDTGFDEIDENLKRLKAKYK